MQLLAVTGQLDPRIFAPATQIYDPAKNFRSVRNRGMTPLEIPVRVLEIVTSPGLDRPSPKRVLEVDVPPPALIPMPPAPAPAPAPRSIADLLEADRQQAIKEAKEQPVPEARPQ